MLLALKMGGAASPSRSWERLGVDSPLESPERNQPRPHLDSDLQN